MNVTSTSTDQQIEQLVERYGATLYRLAYTIVRDRGAAEDIVQEVLVKAWTTMPSWDGDVPIRWARTVTRNQAISYLRAVSARPATPSDDLDRVAGDTASPEEQVERAQNSETMWRALGRLAEEQRTMLVMHEVEGLTYDEIATTLRLSVSAVKSKLYRARIALRREVER